MRVEKGNEERAHNNVGWGEENADSLWPRWTDDVERGVVPTAKVPKMGGDGEDRRKRYGLSVVSTRNDNPNGEALTPKLQT